MIISLGELCYVSAMLKRLGLKTESHPFDWIFTDATIVSDCIGDSFGRFMDADNHVPGFAHNQSRHTVYRNPFGNERYRHVIFNHHNICDTDTRAYFSRCVERFLHRLHSNERLTFIHMLIDGVHERGIFTDGDVTGAARTLHNVLRNRHNTKLIVVHCRYHPQSRRVECDNTEIPDTVIVRIDITSKLKGIEFANKADTQFVDQSVRALL